MGTWHVAAGEAQNSNKLIVDIMHYIHCIAMLGIMIMYPPHPAAAEGIIGLAAWWHLAHLTPSIAIVRSCSSSLFVKVHKGKLVQIFWETWHIFCHVGLQCYNAGPCHAGEMLNILTTRDCNCSLCWWVSPRECAGGKQTKPHINNTHNTIEWQWCIYLTQDRCSKIENFPDKSLSSSMVSLLPCLWWHGPVVESCDPDIVVTLEHWHNYTLLHHNPHQWPPTQ